MPEPMLLSPYLASAPLRLKGNLHTHTTSSDGVASPQEAVDRYAELGHDFLQLADHDTLTPVEDLDGRGMVLIQGVELSCAGTHILDVGARQLVSTATDRQTLLNSINSTSGFPVLCHPNWGEDFNHFPYDVMADLTGYIGLEIFNGAVINQPGNHLALDKWDRLLASGKCVWGFANDDTHQIAEAGRGWNVVFTSERSPRAILDAFRKGSFYVSSGVMIEEIICEGSRLRIFAPDSDGFVVVGRHGARLYSAEGPLLEFDAAHLEVPYFRVECLGRRGTAAWTQPFYIRGGKHERILERLRDLGAGEKSALKAHRTDVPPDLTEGGDDPVWRRVIPHVRFLSMKDGEPSPVHTEVRCIVASNGVYFAFHCEEPNLEQMKLRAIGNGSRNIWTDDSIELFLDPGLTRTSAFQIMMNARGYVTAVPRGPVSLPVPTLYATAGRWSEGTKRGWHIKLGILFPASAIEALCRGARWGLHICRNRHAGENASYVWSWVGTSNHNIREYGTLSL